MFRVCNRRLNVSRNVHKILLKSLAITCGSVKIGPLSKFYGWSYIRQFFQRD